MNYEELAMDHVNEAFENLVNKDIPLTEWDNFDLLDLQWLIMRILARRLESQIPLPE